MSARGFGYDRYCIGNLDRFPERCFDLPGFGLYHAKTQRDALDAARADRPWAVIRLDDLTEVPIAAVRASEAEQARAQDPSLTRPHPSPASLPEAPAKRGEV